MTNDLFLGLIALGVLVMAGIQVGAIVFLVRAARRMEAGIGQLRQDVNPILTNLQTMSTDAARATAKAAAQVDRLEKLLADLVQRIDQTASTLQDTVLAPIREAMSIVHGIKAAFAALRGFGEPRAARKAKPAPAEDDDSMFVG